MVWVHINTNRYMAWKFRWLKLMVDGPFNIIEKIGENAYNLELLSNFDILPIANVKDLRSYQGEDLREIFFPNHGGLMQELLQQTLRIQSSLWKIQVCEVVKPCRHQIYL